MKTIYLSSHHKRILNFNYIMYRAAATLLAEHCQKFVIGIKDHLQNGERENMKEVVVETERYLSHLTSCTCIHLFCFRY